MIAINKDTPFANRVDYDNVLVVDDINDTGNTLANFYMSYSNRFRSVKHAVIVNNTWKMITVVNSGTYQYIYVNGVVGEVKATVSNSLNEIKPLYLGNPPTNPAGTSVQQIKISRYKFYNKALSASEISSNFSAQKTIYGL
jgi:hypothetical protein